MSDDVRDPVQSALDELRAFGLLIDAIDFGAPKRGTVHRVDVEGQKKGKRAGWYVCHELRLDDGRMVVVGSYGIWEGDRNNAQKLKLRGAKLDDGARLKIKKRQQDLAAQAEVAEAELARETAARAKEIWEKLPFSGASSAPYLVRKSVAAYGLCRGRDGILVVPLRNAAGMLTQLQFINTDGEKKFLTGPGKHGSFHLIGTVANEQPLIFAEGYATGASIHMATGWPVVVCIDAGNMLEVAKRLRSVYPAARFVFAADDDHEKKRNTGREIVTEGAKRFRGAVVFPRFNDPVGRTDFNDVHMEQGLEAVAEQLHAIVTPTLPAGADQTHDSWIRTLVYTDKGDLKPMVRNVMTVLLNHPDWKRVFAFDAFTKRIVKKVRPPLTDLQLDENGMPPKDWWKDGWLRDVDEIETAAWFGESHTFASAIPTSIAREAILAVAERRLFHPVRDYLDSLKWDGEDRLAEFFSDYCNVPRSETIAGFAKNFFIQAVARIYDPGCKADLMLVLEGEQGARKSTLAATLAGIGAYADVGTGPSDKDFFQIIQGVWLVEISEMASFAKAENSHIKRAISVAIDRFRKSYGHNVEDFKRECVFFGTANNSDWQKDETGGRRYMPVWVGEIDIDGVKQVRDQLWAEAVHRYSKGEPHWILPEGASQAQDDRHVSDVWTEPVVRWLNGKRQSSLDTNQGMAKEVVTVSQVLTWALDVEIKKQDRSAQTRVGNILNRLKWTKKQRRSDGVREYHRPKETT